MKKLFLLLAFVGCFGMANAQWTDGGATIWTNDKVAIGANSINNNFDEFLLTRNKTGPVIFKVENTGTNSGSAAIFTMKNNTPSSDIRMQWSINGVGTWYMGVDNSDASKLKFKWNSSNLEDAQLTVARNGMIGIGTDNPASMLSINGNMESEEVQVKQDVADYVFKEDYQLMSLEQLENFINVNGHLPNVQNEKEVAENRGLIKLGELSVSVLEKVEELTLHVIELNKRVKSLEAENAKLKEELKK